MNELTREQILSMPAGRELDRLVALNVMGFEPSKMTPKLVRKGVRASIVEPYSTYIVSAWEVEKKIKEMGETQPLMIGYYMAELILIVGNNGFDMVHATAEQRCKAVLLAVLRL